ncbi:hypothetical protein H0484_06090 [Pusillimonas sp. CC-YST705]|uniref:ABC transporter permease n=1 Tax=Mesopusillimonas faecipullorum TaxID=2755040 RepID=A0ABS8CBC7_9BURK|nr:hypothetical protein [Mesopusillimonas faecipullorum]MCB5363323.1 hypothetical protein [Mesopusillimonas faecipullorum]
MKPLISLLHGLREGWHKRRPSRLRMPGVMRLRPTLAMLVPVLLVGCMMLFELAHLGLTIYSAGAALDRTLARWTLEPQLIPAPESLPQQLSEQVSQALSGRLPASSILVQVRDFTPQKGQRAANNRARSLTMDVYQTYVTPLSGLFGLGDAFRYRYKRFMGHPAASAAANADAWVPCCLLPSGPERELNSPYFSSALWGAGVALLGVLAWYLGVGSASVAFVFVLLTVLAGAQAGAFVVVTTVAGGFLAIFRLPYVWALLISVLWWVAQ